MLCSLTLPIHLLSSLHPVTWQEHHRAVLPAFPKFSSQPLLDDEVAQVTLCAYAHACACCVLSHVRLFATPWTVAHQAPLSKGFPRQEYWSRLPYPPSGDLPDPGIKPMPLASPALAGGFFIPAPPGKLLPSLVLLFLFLKFLLEYSCLTVLR